MSAIVRTVDEIIASTNGPKFAMAMYVLTWGVSLYFIFALDLAAWTTVLGAGLLISTSGAAYAVGYCDAHRREGCDARR